MAALQVILGGLTGKSVDLFSFGEISKKLRMSGGAERGLQEIPIDAIVGSVGRYTDFTRSFLPRRDADIERWARVKAQIVGNPVGLPPIEVYKIGEIYFVRDGHHRVSVAREIGQKYIQARVVEIITRVPLTADTSPEDLILKSEYAEFLTQTRIDYILPNVDVRLTVPGLYPKLQEHIQVHRYFMGLDLRRDISLEEAVEDWYATQYLPVTRAIRERGILREFPGRTEADLYIWISEHRHLLEKELGWHIRSDVAARSLTSRMSPRPGRVFQRLRRRWFAKIIPEPLEDNPTPGEWMESIQPERECLFKDILVPVNGQAEGWVALDQAISLARCPSTRLHGLYVFPDGASLESQATQEVRAEFERRCREANLDGNLAIVTGEVAHQVVERGRLTDLVILNLAHPPASQVLARLNSGFRTILRTSARPVLAVPGVISPADCILLAFDGSEKAREGLFVSAFLAGKYRSRLTVVSVANHGRNACKRLKQAEGYLEERRVRADYIEGRGPVGEEILRIAENERCNLIVMGGYGYKPMLEVVLGSAVDYVLQQTQIPVMVCQ